MLRIYVDTSVFGGMFDEEFSDISQRFFKQVSEGRFKLVTSAVVQQELEPAPEKVKQLFQKMLPLADIVSIEREALELQQAYITEGVVTATSALDALHVALATVNGCDLIISWNFKHIVHFDKIPMYNAVNTLKNFGHIDIYSPREVIHYEEDI
ncbi:MAG: type II toxin-antitoxin system VapC family toxin [SAR324 cluster bacterium]|nr:type II toxin-antitoxin system VapC family toxin [SAR324 cluster bacterium]